MRVIADTNTVISGLLWRGTPRRVLELAREAASEIYRDVESGYYVFIGSRGRTHVFTVTGVHHTSFRTTQANRLKRQSEDKWERIERAELPDGAK